MKRSLVIARTVRCASTCWWLSALMALAGCAGKMPPRGGNALPALPALYPSPAPAPAEAAAVLPAPPVRPPSTEPRFDLIVNGASARDVFLAIVSDTRYSMLMHPDVTGPLSVTLRGVTVQEALESIRDVYGYDFKLEGRRITV